MKKSKAQIHKESVEELQKNSICFRLDNPECEIAGLDADGNLFLMEDDHLEPKEALRLAAWIIDMFEEREVAE